MINIKNVYKSYGDKEVIKNVSFEIKEGEIFGIIGHSGAGKSTMLRCINRLEDYNEGSINVDGKEVKNLNDFELRRFRKDLGMIFQGFNLLNRKNVYENIALPLEVWGYKEEYEEYKLKQKNENKKWISYRKYKKEKIDNRVNELLALIGLEDKAKEKIKNLSGGQKQRIGIARALALEPKILLCDEATSALDPKITKDILVLLKKINKELGITVVIVTHEMEVIKEICERIVLLDGGEVKASGRVEELFLNPKVELKKFLGEEDEEFLPNDGVNIKLFFENNKSQTALITEMARELDINISIVWGRLEKFRDDILGSLVMNIEEKNQDKVKDYLKNKNIIWEVM